MTPYKSGTLSPEQVYELELSSRSPVEFLQIRPAVIAELVRAYNVCGFILASCRCEFRKGHEGEHSFEPALRSVDEGAAERGRVYARTCAACGELNSDADTQVRSLNGAPLGVVSGDTTRVAEVRACKLCGVMYVRNRRP